MHARVYGINNRARYYVIAARLRRTGPGPGPISQDSEDPHVRPTTIPTARREPKTFIFFARTSERAGLGSRGFTSAPGWELIIRIIAGRKNNGRGGTVHG